MPDLPTLDLAALTRHAIAVAIEETNGNVRKAASLLGIGRATLYRRLETDVDLGATLRRVRREEQARG